MAGDSNYLGTFVQGTMSIPAGGDANIVHSVITAGEVPVRITAASYWGGDSGQTLACGLVSPSNTPTSLKEWSYYSDRGGIVALSGPIEGAVSQNDEQALTVGRDRASWMAQMYIPANYTLVVWVSSANTAAWNITFAGFECA